MIIYIYYSLVLQSIHSLAHLDLTEGLIAPVLKAIFQFENEDFTNIVIMLVMVHWGLALGLSVDILLIYALSFMNPLI